MKHIYLFILALALVISVSAQGSFNMPSSGNVSQTSDNCWIYDDGGISGSYGSYAHSSLSLQSASNGVVFAIYLEYEMEMPHQTYVKIYDEISETLIFSTNQASDIIEIKTCTDRIRVEYHTDSENPQGFGFAMHVTACPKISGARVEVLSYSTARISWDANPNVNEYYVVYGNPLDTIVVYGNDTTLTDLTNCALYYFGVFSACDLAPRESNCYIGWIQCPCPIPLWINQNAINDGYLVSWGEPYSGIEWTVVLKNKMGEVVDSTSSYYSNSIFYEGLVDTFTVIVYSNCLNESDEQLCNVSITLCPPCPFPTAAIIYDSVYANTESIRVKWANDDNVRKWIASIYTEGSSTPLKTNTVEDGNVTFSNLTPETRYIITIRAYNDTIGCSMIALNLFTYGNCIDYSNFESPAVKATYGYFENPYMYSGYVDYGEEAIFSRHTVIERDTTIVQKDPRTDSTLVLVPAGFNQSVRLGNWNGMKEAESITYTYLIDTSSFDLIILRYAAVMKNPFNNHSQDRMPSFTLEILDSNGTLIDTVCGFANFVVGSNTNDWYVAKDSVLWKDWTAAGFDIAKYHGKKINVRLTTRDCADGNDSHFGYAYFVLECATKIIKFMECGEVTVNTFYAPDGFNYEWYQSGVDTLISTNRILQVQSNGEVRYYYCIISNKENPNCKFSSIAASGNRFPIANFDYEVTFRDCKFFVRFYNKSIVSAKRENIVQIEDHCETAKWHFHDGNISYVYNYPDFIYYNEGDYAVKLVVGLLNNACTDTIEKIVHLVKPPMDSLYIIGDNYICKDSNVVLTASMAGTYLWNTGETTPNISVIAQNTTTYSVEVKDSFNCTHRAEHTINVKHSYKDINVYDTICKDQYYAPEGTPILESGLYHLNLKTKDGCDSIINLLLNIKETCDLIFVPNSFTPDDNRNNIFKPYSSENMEITFEIYNRYGALLFKSHSLNEGWDGTFKGTACQQGVYVWKLLYRSLDHQAVQRAKSGTLMLLR